MRLAVRISKNMPFSISLYTYSIINELLDLGVYCITYHTYEELEGQDYDLIWHPLLSGLWIPDVELYSLDKPVVATLHGVRPFIFDEETIVAPEKAQILRELKTSVIDAWSQFRDRVDQLIAVSFGAKKEIIDIYQMPEEKMSVIYHGVDHDIFAPAMRADTHLRPYILSLAQYQPVKNIDRLIDGFLQADIPEEVILKLHLPNYPEGLVHNRIFISKEKLTEPQLAQLYQGAEAFVFPSFHESFGLPVLEAMACGCPVITTRQTGTGEVCGTAAKLIDPRSTADIKTAIEQVVNDPNLRQQMITKGLERAAMFTWSDAARHHLEVFQRAMTDSVD